MLEYPFLKETKTVFTVHKHSLGERMDADCSTAVYERPLFNM